MEHHGTASSGTPSSPLEIYFALSLSIFAAVLSLNELGAGVYGQEELKMSNEKTGAYLWYQSKGLKEALAESQRDLLKALLESGTIVGSQSGAVQARIGKTDESVTRYKKEKKEILLGSATVGRENWVQDVDGKMGQVIGAKEYEARAEKYGDANERFDLATVFLQICLVLGAIGLMMKQEKRKKLFLGGIVALGLIGLGVSVSGYWIAWS